MILIGNDFCRCQLFYNLVIAQFPKFVRKRMDAAENDFCSIHYRNTKALYNMKKSLSKNQELLVVTLISLYLFFIGINRGGTQLVIADITDLFNIGTEGIGLLTTLQQVPPLFMPLLFGMVADKIGKKPVVVAFVAVFAAGCIICGSSTGLIMYIIGTLVYKSGSTVSENISTAVLSDLNEEKGMQYINLSQFMFSLGAAAGPMAFEFMKAEWQTVFYFSAVSFIVMTAVLSFIKFPANPVQPDSKRANDAVFINEESGSEQKKHSFVKPVICILAVTMFCIIGMETGYGNFIDSFTDYKYNNGTTSALTLSSFWIGMAISRLLFSFVKYNAVKSLRICFASGALFIALLTFIERPVLTIIISGLIGFSYGPTWCTINALAAANSEGNSGTAVGIMSVLSGIGGMIVPSIIGQIAGRNNIVTAVWVIVVTAATGSFMSFFIKDKK